MKFRHISTVGVYNTTRFSAIPTNDAYFTGADPKTIIEGSPTVLYDDLVFCKGVKLIYTHGTLYEASETDLTDYYTRSQVDSTFATKNELSAKQDKITGNSGEVVYHDGSEVFTQTVMSEGYVVDTTSDLNKCKTLTDPNHYIYDFTTNTVLEFNASLQAWTIVENKNPLTEMGVGRFSYNKTTGKLFYNNGVVVIEVSRVFNLDSEIGWIEH